MNILRWFGWERDEGEHAFDPSRRLFLRRGTAAMLAPVLLLPAVTYFLPQPEVLGVRLIKPWRVDLATIGSDLTVIRRHVILEDLGAGRLIFRTVGAVQMRAHIVS